MVKARSDAIGVLCGSLVSLVFVVLAGAGYKNLPMPDPLGFLVFVAASLSVALSLAFTAGAWLATRIFSSARRRVAIATGVAATGLILWPWWVSHVLGRQSQLIELAAIAVSALALASSLWISLTGFPLERRAGGASTRSESFSSRCSHGGFTRRGPASTFRPHR